MTIRRRKSDFLVSKLPIIEQATMAYWLDQSVEFQELLETWWFKVKCLLIVALNLVIVKNLSIERCHVLILIFGILSIASLKPENFVKIS